MTVKSFYHTMAYEVVKTIGGRPYRYRVERVADPATGKKRSRWTYLGRVDPATGERPRTRRTDGRERLLDALERLLEVTDFGAVTAGAIAAEAGVAHGTFYRHFRDKRDALRSAFERVRERRGPTLDMLRDDVPSREAARAALRACFTTVLEPPAKHPALLRAFYALVWRDAELSQERRERKATSIAAIARYLGVLRERGFAAIDDCEATAAGILALIDGLYRDSNVDGIPLDAARIRAAATLVDRGVFASPDA
jgi:AcrR family transcriptional regulator